MVFPSEVCRKLEFSELVKWKEIRKRGNFFYQEIILIWFLLSCTNEENVFTFGQ